MATCRSRPQCHAPFSNQQILRRRRWPRSTYGLCNWKKRDITYISKRDEPPSIHIYYIYTNVYIYYTYICSPPHDLPQWSPMKVLTDLCPWPTFDYYARPFWCSLLIKRLMSLWRCRNKKQVFKAFDLQKNVVTRCYKKMLLTGYNLPWRQDNPSHKKHYSCKKTIMCGRIYML